MNWIGLSYWPNRLHRLAESIPGLLKSLKIPSQVCPMCEATFSLEVRQEEFEQHVLQHFRYISGRFVTKGHIELGRNVWGHLILILWEDVRIMLQLWGHFEMGHNVRGNCVTRSQCAELFVSLIIFGRTFCITGHIWANILYYWSYSGKHFV
jgi:hypothetical protein